MDLFTLLLIAVSLAMDAFAVSLGIGATEYARHPRAVFRLSFHFGLFQALMPVLGWLAGSTVAGLIQEWDHWVALVLLSWVGLRMIHSSLTPNGSPYAGDPSRGRTLVMLAVATSLDAFAIGLSLAMLKVQIGYPSVVIGVVTGSLSLMGLAVGSGLGRVLGKWAGFAGGLVLIGIGVRIVLTHLPA